MVERVVHLGELHSRYGSAHQSMVLDSVGVKPAFIRQCNHHLGIYISLHLLRNGKLSRYKNSGKLHHHYLDTLRHSKNYIQSYFSLLPKIDSRIQLDGWEISWGATFQQDQQWEEKCCPPRQSSRSKSGNPGGAATEEASGAAWEAD